MSSGVVLRRLDVQLPGIQHLPRDQGLEDRIGQVDILREPKSSLEVVHAGRGHDAFIEIRSAAVVPEIIGAKSEQGNPQDLARVSVGLRPPTLRPAPRPRSGAGRRKVAGPLPG